MNRFGGELRRAFGYGLFAFPLSAANISNVFLLIIFLSGSRPYAYGSRLVDCGNAIKGEICAVYPRKGSKIVCFNTFREILWERLVVLQVVISIGLEVVSGRGYLLLNGFLIAGSVDAH